MYMSHECLFSTLHFVTLVCQFVRGTHQQLVPAASFPWLHKQYNITDLQILLYIREGGGGHRNGFIGCVVVTVLIKSHILFTNDTEDLHNTFDLISSSLMLIPHESFTFCFSSCVKFQLCEIFGSHRRSLAFTTKPIHTIFGRYFDPCIFAFSPEKPWAYPILE